MKKLTKPLKLIIFLVVLYSCETEEAIGPVLEEVTNTEAESELEIISGTELSYDLRDNIGQISDVLKYKSYSKKEIPFGKIDWKQVRKLKTKERTTYTFGLTNAQKGYYYDNLIIGKNKKGKIGAVIMRYEPNRKWYNENTLGIANFGSYEGNIKVYDRHGIMLFKTVYKNGVAINGTVGKAGKGTECFFMGIEYSGIIVIGSHYYANRVDQVTYSFYCYLIPGLNDASTTSTVNNGAGNPGDFSGSPFNANDKWDINSDLFLTVQGDYIADMSEYLECFDLNKPATFTLFADQPLKNTNETWVDRDPSWINVDPDVGHSFVSISQGGTTRYFGFYPAKGIRINPIVNRNSGQGSFVNDSKHEYDVSITKSITNTQLKDIINKTKSFAKKGYDLNFSNCTDFALQVANSAGINIGNCYGTWPSGGGDNPGVLGQKMRKNSQGTLDIKGGLAGSNKGICN